MPTASSSTRWRPSLPTLKAKGITPKFIYTIPTIQNPTASILPLDRRHALLKLAREYNVAIFEDECYADLLWEGVEAPPALYALDPGCVIHLGSFSKSLAPALRLGYIVAEWEIMRRLLPLKGDSGTGALDQMVVAEYFSKNFDKHLRHLNGVLHDKLNTMVEAVEREFGAAAECWHPEGRHLPVDQAAGQGGCAEAAEARRRSRHHLQRRSGLGGQSGQLQFAPAAVLRHAEQADDPRRCRGAWPRCAMNKPEFRCSSGNVRRASWRRASNDGPDARQQRSALQAPPATIGAL